MKPKSVLYDSMSRYKIHSHMIPHIIDSPRHTHTHNYRNNAWIHYVYLSNGFGRVFWSFFISENSATVFWTWLFIHTYFAAVKYGFRIVLKVYNDFCPWYNCIPQNSYHYTLRFFRAYGKRNGQFNSATMAVSGRSRSRSIWQSRREFMLLSAIKISSAANTTNPSSRTMALGSTQPLTEMSTRNFHGA
jgi:hypothetical protein